MFAYTKIMQGIQAVSTAVTDAYFNLVTLLLNTSSTNGAQNNTFLDSSTNNFTITRNGNTTQGTFTPFSQTGWSNYLGGAGNYFQTPANSASTIVGTLSSTTNLTIECWIYPTAYNSSANFPGLIGDMQATAENNNWSWGITNTGTLMLYWGTGSQVRAYTTNTVSLNTWTHIALNIASGAITMYINGVSQTLTGTTTFSAPSGSNNYLVIGQWNNGSGGTGGVSNGLFTGYISNLRVVKASTYTSSFTPSTTPLTAITNTSLLYCQSNRFVDNSSNALAITTSGTPSVQAFSPFLPTAAYDAAVVGGSGYFDGTGDYLATPSTSAFNFGTNAFTIECWIYQTALSGQTPWFFASGSNGAGFGFQNTSNWGFVQTGVAWALTTTTLPKLNSWNHVVVCRASTSSNQASLFLNGVRVANGTISQTISSTGAYYCGYDGTQIYNGYISGLRVNDTDVYGYSNTTITVPTAPPTAITNTSLLLNYTNSGIYDSAAKNVLETVGNAQVSTTQAKWGTTSMAFDGTGDYLVSNSGTDLYAFGSGNFTIEFWAYLNTVSGSQIFYDSRPSGTQTTQPTIFMSGAVVSYYTNNSTVITGSTLSTGQWYHIAVSRSGTSTKMFVNGTQVGSTYTDSTVYTNTSGRPLIGADSFAVGTNPLNGYIDDLRVTKGYARYTANFTAPTAAFPLQ